MGSFVFRFPVLVVCLLVGACGSVPDIVGLKRGVVSQEGGYINASDRRGDQGISQWWTRIDDASTARFVEQLLAENLELAQAGERVIQARARRDIARGGFLPSLGAGADAGRSASTISGSRVYSNSYAVDFNAAWQVDLFGRVRKSYEAADAQFDASQYDAQALTHSLIAEVVNRRVAIATGHAFLKLAQRNADNRQKTYEVVKNRYQTGSRGTSLADVYLAEENAKSVAGDVFEFERLLADEMYAFDVLMGQVPGTTNPLVSNFPLLAPPRDVAVCLPADLLDRRPDLRASELRLKASNANIGVAVADLYPALNLAGNIGFNGDDLGDLFSIDQIAGSVLASLTSRLFEGGALRANVRLKESEARELAAGYAQNILNAFKDVESALKAEQLLRLELSNAQESAMALQKAEDLSLERYIRGILTLREFLDVQQRRYGVEQALLNTQQSLWGARISLYMALGGDWLGENDGLDMCEQRVAM